MNKKEHYVYWHLRGDGKIFYIGKGKGKRAWEITNRSRSWLREVAEHGVFVVIVHANMDEREAMIFEIDQIKFWSKDYDLVNKQHAPDINPFRDRDEIFLKSYTVDGEVCSNTYLNDAWGRLCTDIDYGKRPEELTS